MQYDVIVVGAGPAGTTTGRECAERGLSTLLLDKAEFPRDKPCGGGVTVRAASLLPFGLEGVTERTALNMRISVNCKKVYEDRGHEPLTYLTQRRHLDAFLVEHAIRAGVTLRERETVRDVEPSTRQVLVRTENGSFTGRALVAADGVNGKTARLAGLQLDRRLVLGLEGNVNPVNGFPRPWEDTLGIDLGGIPGGYGWIFPKEDHLNIGVAGWQQLGPSLRSRLDALARFYGVDPARMWGLRGHHLPMRRTGAPIQGGNMLLVGDSAGLIDPLTLEGIYAAIWSGRVAARHLAAFITGGVPNLAGYQQELDGELMTDINVGRRIYELSSLVSPRIWMEAAARTPRMWRLLRRLMRGEQTYASVTAKHRAASAALELMSVLVQRTPYVRRRAYLE